MKIFGKRKKNLGDIFTLFRPKHWIKNIFVIAPLIFSFSFMDIDRVLFSLVAFFCFSLAASAVYTANDVFDRDRDKMHPEKKNRPIASGRVSVRLGISFSIILSLSSISIAYLISPMSALTTLFYLVINLFYSLYLKHVALLDVFTIATGFVLRVVMGAVSIQVDISTWILLVTVFLSLFLGFGKRYNELLLENSHDHREVLGSYSTNLLSLFMAMSAVLTIVIYTFYTIDPVVVGRFHTTRLMYTIPVVVFGIFRYMQLVIQEKTGGDVAEVVLADNFIKVAVLLYVLQVLWAFQW